MGAWSEQSFGNDAANDWKEDFLEDAGLAFVGSTLEEAAVDGYLDVDVGCRVIAACEVLARLAGRFGLRDSYSERLDEWVLENADVAVPALLAQRAVAALDRITGPTSELAELWATPIHSADVGRWRVAVADLRQRLLGGRSVSDPD